MTISSGHLFGSCKAAPGRCYNRNGPHAPALRSQLLRLLSLSLLVMVLAAMPTSCLAQTPLSAESTTPQLEDIEEVTTAIPPPNPSTIAEDELKPTPAAAVNETIAPVEPAESSAAEAADEVVQNSFVALGGEGLEQGIRNAVKSEVESELEANSPTFAGILQVTHTESEQQINNNNDEQTAQPAREPKALEPNAEQQVQEFVKAAEPVNESAATEPHPVEEEAKAVVGSDVQTSAEPVTAEPAIPEKSSQTESTIGSDLQEAESRPLPSVTSDLVAVIFDENRAITEQPITKTNILELAKEHENLHDVIAKQESAFEVPKHQVTKKQGVDDLLPIVEKVEEPVAAPEVEGLPETKPESVDKQEGENTVGNAVENASETPVEPAATVPPVQSVESAQPAQSVEAAKSVDAVQSSEPAQPAQSVQAVESVQPAHAAQSVQPVQSIETVPPVAVAHAEQSAESTEAENKSVSSEEKEIIDEAAVSSTAKPEGVTSTEPAAEPVVVEAVQNASESTGTEDEPSSTTVEPSSESAQPVEFSSTAAPSEEEIKNRDESVENESSDSDSDSDASGAKKAQAAVNGGEKDSSEESEEQSEEEPKARAEDSTATPLVSYPPHNAGQTFDSNLADERSAHLSFASSNRSTLIIALCSGTAVLFIVVSLVIFVLSFQRQHGTLDIEMQEQRLGKDDLDQEDAQMKLLDVDLSPPVIVAMGNEETDECL